MKKRRVEEEKTKKTLASVCQVFHIPRLFRWNDFYAHLCNLTPVYVRNFLKVEKYLPNTVERLFFLRFIKQNIPFDVFETFVRFTSISFHQCNLDISHMGLQSLYPTLIRLNYPVMYVPSMGRLWLEWRTDTHLSLPKRLCAQVKSLLLGIRHLPKDLRIRIVRTFVLMDYPFDCVGHVGDTAVIQSKDEEMKANWALENWAYFDASFKHSVIRKFVDENQLESMFYKLGMKLDDLKLDWFKQVQPDSYAKLHPIACKLGYIGDDYIPQWSHWHPENHLKYNNVFRRETKMILLIFRKFSKEIQLKIIEFLSCLYGYENILYVNYDRFHRWEANDIHTLLHPSVRETPRSKEKSIQLFLKTQSFINLLK